MATPKGYPTQEKNDRAQAEHATVSPSGQFKHGLDVLDRSTVFVSGNDAAEAGSTDILIVATAHGLQAGDRLRFTSGVHTGVEVDVLSIPDANTIEMAQRLSVPVADGDTFDILKPISFTLSPSGQITTSQAPLQFRRDGLAQEVVEDTLDPANNIPLPVKLTGISGDVNINANQLLVQLSHTGPTPDSTQIGDGTTILSIVPGTGEGRVQDAGANALLATIDADTSNLDVLLSTRASEATLASLDGKVVAVDTSNVTVVASVLPTGAATEATLATRASEATLAALNAKVTAVDTSNVTVVASALPTGAATEATLLATAGSLVSIDTSLNNIETRIDTNLSTRASEATLASLDGKVVTVDTGNVSVVASALPVGAATETTLGNVLTAVSAGATEVTLAALNTQVTNFDRGAGPVSAQTLRSHLSDESLAALENITVQISTQSILNTSFTDVTVDNIPGSASAPLELLASTAGDIQKLQFADTTGAFLEIMSGAVSSEVREVLVGPGSDQTIEVSIPAGTRISVRRIDSATAASAGALAINYLG